MLKNIKYSSLSTDYFIYKKMKNSQQEKKMLINNVEVQMVCVQVDWEWTNPALQQIKII